MPRYTGNPSVTIDGTLYVYDTEGETGPQLLGDALGHPRQAESDANWPGGAVQKAIADDLLAREELLAIDMRSIRALRENDTARIATLKAEAIAARARLRPKRPGRPPPAQP